MSKKNLNNHDSEHEQFQKIENKILDFVSMHDRLPLTRREFLGAGLIQFGGFLTLSPLLGGLLGSRRAQAAMICDAVKSSDLPALITLNLAGGAGLSANWMPLDQGLQPLASYSKMGWGVGPTMTREFANQAPFFNGSPFLTALRTATSDPMVRLNTHFVGIAVRSQDDTSSNHFDITGLTKTAGLSGSLLANLGTANTITGNNTQPAFITPPAPLVVSSYNDVVGALSISGSLSKIASRAPAMFATINKLNSLQAQKHLAKNYGQQLEQLMVCRSDDNTKLVTNSNGSATDPLTDTNIATTWGLQGNTSKSSRDYIFATLVYNALAGNAGSANLTIGGYDYHNGTRATGDAKDAEAGTVVGRILTSAARLNRKVFVLVTSDGSVTSSESDLAGSPWASDGGLRGSTYMIAFDPTAATQTKSYQLGHYTNSQAADDKTIVGTSPERAAAAMFANYLSFAKKIDLFEKILPRVFSTTELESVRIFG